MNKEEYSMHKLLRTSGIFAIAALIAMSGCDIFPALTPPPPDERSFDWYVNDQRGTVLGDFAFTGADDIKYTLANADVAAFIGSLAGLAPNANTDLEIEDGKLKVREVIGDASAELNKDTELTVTVTATSGLVVEMVTITITIKAGSRPQS